MANNSSLLGVGLTELLFIVFLTLKLTSAIDWSWWWVTAPLWGAVAIFLLMLSIIVLIEALKD